MKKELANKEKWNISFIKALKYSFFLLITFFILNIITDLLPFYNPRFLGSLLISLSISITLFFPILVCERVLLSKDKGWHKFIFLILPLLSYFEVILFYILLKLSLIDTINNQLTIFDLFPIGTSIFIFAILSLLIGLIISGILYILKKNEYK